MPGGVTTSPAGPIEKIVTCCRGGCRCSGAIRDRRRSDFTVGRVKLLDEPVLGVSAIRRYPCRTTQVPCVDCTLEMRLQDPLSHCRGAPHWDGILAVSFRAKFRNSQLQSRSVT
jgi:hypothetical protein